MKPNILIISDSVGETARGVVFAGLSQFDSHDVEIKRYSYVKEVDDINAILDTVNPGQTMLVFTLINPDLREKIIDIAKARRFPHVDIMGPLMEALQSILNSKPRLEPGLLHQLDEDYFRRMQAIDFAVKYDDLNDARGIRLADVVLIGVSRTSKTPICVYMAYRGYKAANIPLVPEVTPPDLLFKNPGHKIIGLTIDPLLLNEIRMERLRILGLDQKAQYASIKRINEELNYAAEIMAKVGCPVIDVTSKSIEESANEVLRYIKIE